MVRRSFDIGSGSIKCMVAEVDARGVGIERVLYERTEPHIHVSGRGADVNTIEPAARAAGLDILQQMLADTRALAVDASAGIATHGFRSSINGAEVVAEYAARTGVPISIASPAEEGRLAFRTAGVLSAANCAEPEQHRAGHRNEQLVAVDCGAGSFQLTAWAGSHSEPHGSGSIRAVADDVTRELEADGPLDVVARGELIRRLLAFLHNTLLPTPTWLDDMPSPMFVALGSAQSIFNQQRVIGGSPSFSQRDVRNSLAEVAACSPSQLLELERGRGKVLPGGYDATDANGPYILPKLVLLHALMSRFRMPSIQFHQTHGNCAGLLVHPEAWDEVITAALGATHQRGTGPGSDSTAEADCIDTCPTLLTVNWHLEKHCNYSCKFCYAHFADTPGGLSEEEGRRLLDSLRSFGVYKINFAGGEPMLNRHLGAFLKHARGIGLKTSIITNASKLTLSWLREHCSSIDQIGISCDSLDDRLNKWLGRGFGNHVALTQRALDRVHLVNAEEGTNIRVKLNTVVMRQNHLEDWSDFILDHRVQRWKIFKALRIEGENEEFFDQEKSGVSDANFQAFVARHAHLDAMVPETNDDMTDSYVMVTPDGRFYQNSAGKYSYSSPILEVGPRAGLEQVGFDYAKFTARGGAYAL